MIAGFSATTRAIVAARRSRLESMSLLIRAREAGSSPDHGTTMMRLALARCFAAPGVTAVLIDPLASNTRAHRFYERLGFRFVERRQFGQDDCFVYRLGRADWAAQSSAGQDEASKVSR